MTTESHVPARINQETVQIGTLGSTRDRQHERATWDALASHFHQAVEETAAPGKPYNSLSDRESVEKYVDKTLYSLRFVILVETGRKARKGEGPPT